MESTHAKPADFLTFPPPFRQRACATNLGSKMGSWRNMAHPRRSGRGASRSLPGRSRGAGSGPGLLLLVRRAGRHRTLTMASIADTGGRSLPADFSYWGRCLCVSRAYSGDDVNGGLPWCKGEWDPLYAPSVHLLPRYSTFMFMLKAGGLSECSHQYP